MWIHHRWQTSHCASVRRSLAWLGDPKGHRRVLVVSQSTYHSTGPNYHLKIPPPSAQHGSLSSPASVSLNATCFPLQS